MRTTDFSRAPKQGRAAALLIVEESLGTSGPVRRQATSALRATLRAGRRAEGWVWQKNVRREGTRAALVFFASAGAAASFEATLPRASCRTRVLVAEPSGYSNGVWRAEANVMAHIDHFTPTSIEVARGTTPPPVAGAASSDHAPVLVHDRDARIAATRTAPPRSDATRDHPSAPATAGDLSSAAATAGEHPPPGSGTHRSTEQRHLADARSMFVGATRYRGPAALVVLSRTWYPMVARMRRMRGYVWHTVYWEPPFTLGTLAFFSTRDDLLAFARLPAHRHLMQWITDGTKNGTGGYIRLLEALDENDASGRATMSGGAHRAGDASTEGAAL